MSGSDAALLVVDDIDDNRFALSRRLARQGYLNVTTAVDGRQALELLNSKSFDLVLLDIMMPTVNGYEVLAQMKASSSLRHIPVIMISAIDEIDSVIRCIELGAEDYLPKPFNPTLLRARVGACLERKRLHDEVTARTRELSESLEQQTATSEVLQVISSSPGELEPVFQTMLENATRICGAKFGVMWLCEDGGFRAVALHGPTAHVEERRRDPLIYPSRKLLGAYRSKPSNCSYHGHQDGASLRRTHPDVRWSCRCCWCPHFLAVPMLKENELIGAITIYRQEVRPFTDKQIELVQNFAAQAVIAIENTRLLNELRQRTDDLSEALEQQTATSEVLQVISSSPGELEPVFKTMLENATRICEASFGTLLLYDGDVFRHVALHNAPQAWAAEQQRDPVPPRHAARVLYRVADTKQIAHIADIAAENPDEPIGTIAGARTLLIVPMLKENQLIGVFGIYRQEVRLFTDKQIELVQNFAAQAVIAIENTRLLNELRQRTDDLSEALEQQTATSEVLQVIASSPGELEPVFQAMLENAVRICEANFGMLNLHDDGGMCMGHMHNVPPAFAEFLQARSAYQPTSGSLLERVMRTKQVGHTADDAAESGSAGHATLGGARSSVCRADAQGRTSWSARSPSIGRRSGHSPTSRSSWSRTSPRRPSSPSRTRACSTSCANGRMI